jgi:branched-chain amino acid transport system substrate-binding protein
MSRLRLSRAAVAAAVLALAVSACSSGGSSGSSGAASGAAGNSGQTVVLGVIDDVSGSAAAIGTLGKKSAELAVNEMNKQMAGKGPQIKMVFYDNKGDPAETARLTTRLITQDKAVAISCCASSSAAAAAAAVAGAQKVPMLTSTVVQNLTAASQPWYGYLFRTIPANDSLAQANVDFVKGKGWKKVGLSVSSLSYGKEAIPYFQKSIGDAGGSIVGTTNLDPAITDASIQAADLLKGSPDVIMTWDYPGPTAQLVKALRASGSDVPVVSNWSAINVTMTTVAGPSVKNLFSHDDAVPEKAAIKTFADQWKAAYNEDAPINNFGIYGYNIVQVFAAALNAAKNPNAAGVKDALTQLNCVKTVLGKDDACITFGKDNYEGAQGNNFLIFKTLQNSTWSTVAS